MACSVESSPPVCGLPDVPPEVLALVDHGDTDALRRGDFMEEWTIAIGARRPRIAPRLFTRITTLSLRAHDDDYDAV